MRHTPRKVKCEQGYGTAKSRAPSKLPSVNPPPRPNNPHKVLLYRKLADVLAPVFENLLQIRHELIGNGAVD